MATAPLTVNFTSTSTGDFDTLAWTFADASNNVLGTANTPTTSFTFPAAGTYSASLTVSGTGGSNTSAPQTITVNAAPVAPVASFTVDTSSGDAPLTVNFTSTSTGDFNTLTWTFADSANNPIGTANTPTTSFTFPTAGTYSATLTVDGLGGSNTSAPQTITVNAAPIAPVASFTLDTNSGTAPLTVNFTSTSTGDFDTLAWTFADASNNVLGTANTPTTSFTFPTAGTYSASLTVSGTGGSNTSAPQTITVNAAPIAPVASFTVDTSSGTAPLTVNFTSTSTGDFNTLTWTFADSANNPIGTANTPATSFTFPAAGTYTATRRRQQHSPPDIRSAPVAPLPASHGHELDHPDGNFASTSTGDFDTLAWTFAVSGRHSQHPDYQLRKRLPSMLLPSHLLPASPWTRAAATAPLTVNFTSTSTGDFNTLGMDIRRQSNNPIGTANTPTTSFTFPAAGTYSATLTIDGLGGSNTSAPQIITVNAAAVVPVPPPINSPLVFVSNRSGNDEIYVMGTDGTVTNISNNGASDTSPAWSPDGNQIAFVSNRDGNDEIYVMNSDGSNVVRLTNDAASDNTPMWTQNGTLIVFATSRDGNYEIYAMNPDGSNLSNLTNAPSNETNPAPSPDGTKLAYMSDRDGNNEIYVTATDGTVTNLTNSPSSTDSSPSWAPGSKRIVFVSDRESLAQIYIMGADGSNPTRISDLNTPDTHPVWSHDGSQIAFVSQDNGLSQIYVMNTDGTAVSKISDGTGNDSSPAWKQ